MEYTKENAAFGLAGPEGAAPVTESKSPEELLKEKYDEVLKISLVLTPDDDTEIPLSFYFKTPGTPSYDRYLKTASDSMSRATIAFAYDNILPESREDFEKRVAEYPALAIAVGEKLLNRIGLVKTASLKKL